MKLPTCSPVRYAAALTLAFAAGMAGPAHGQVREEEEVRASIQVLNEMMVTPGQAIPERLLSGAQGIAIIPNMLKGGFVIAHGTGGARCWFATTMVVGTHRFLSR